MKRLKTESCGAPREDLDRIILFLRKVQDFMVSISESQEISRIENKQRKRILRTCFSLIEELGSMRFVIAQKWEKKGFAERLSERKLLGVELTERLLSFESEGNIMQISESSNNNNQITVFLNMNKILEDISLALTGTRFLSDADSTARLLFGR